MPSTSHGIPSVATQLIFAINTYYRFESHVSNPFQQLRLNGTDIPNLCDLTNAYLSVRCTIKKVNAYWLISGARANMSVVVLTMQMGGICTNPAMDIRRLWRPLRCPEAHDLPCRVR